MRAVFAGMLVALPAAAAFGPIPLDQDQGFGANGFSRVPLPTAFEPGQMFLTTGHIYSLSVEAGAAGARKHYVTRRLAATGAVDAGFVSAGTMTYQGTTTDGVESYRGLCVDEATGAIYLAGAALGAGDHSFAVRRFLADGSPDNNYGTGGQARVAMTPDPDPIALGCVVQPDGKLVVVGSKSALEAADFRFGNFAFAARLDASGAPDPGFGASGTGVRLFAPGNVFETVQFSFAATRATLAPNGDIYVVGEGADPRFAATDLLVAKLTPAGDMAEGYGGGNGVFLVRLGDTDERPVGVRHSPGTLGVAMISGTSTATPRFGIIATRLTRAGHVDLGYGCAGFKEGPAAFPPFVAFDGAFDAAGRGVFVGRESSSAEESMVRTTGLPELAVGGSDGTEIAHGCPPFTGEGNIGGGSLPAGLLVLLGLAAALPRSRRR